MNEQSKELVDTLRSVAHTYEEASIGPSSVGLMRQAAARIEYLERERVSLRSGLTRVVDAWSFISGGEQPYQMRDAMQAARAALGTCATLSPATEGEVAK